MAKPCLIVSTCGTSLLTNNANPELRNFLTDFANCSKADDVPAEPRQRIQQHLNARCEDFRKQPEATHGAKC